MKRNIFIALVAIMALGLQSASAQNEDKTTPYIEVRGAASTTLVPNKIEVNITLSEADSKGKVKLSELENSLAKALKAAGVDASKQLVVTGQSSAAEKRNNAFQYKSYTLTLTSAEAVDAVFSAFAENGVANARMGRIFNDKQAEVEAKMKVEAILNAKKTATMLVEALGQQIGEAILVQDFSASPVMYDGDFGMLRASKAANGEVSLPSDLGIRPITVQQSISVRFALK